MSGDWGWVRRLLASTAKHRRLSVLVGVTAVLATGLAVVPPLVMRLGLDDALAGRTDRIGYLAVALGGSALIIFIGSFVRQFLAAKLALAVQHDLRTDVFGSLQRLDGAKQESMRTGQVMSRANIDLQMVQGLLSQAPTAVGSVVLIIVSFAAMVWISPLMTTVHLAMVIASVLVTVFSTRRLSAATWAVQHRNAVLAQIVTETVAAAYVVKGFGQERREVTRFTGESERLYAERLRVARLQSQPMATLQSLPLLTQIGILVLGGYLAISGQISIGDFVAFAAFTATVIAPAGVLSNLVVAAQLAAPAAVRVYELVDTEPEVTDSPDARDLPVGPLGVVLDEVTFGYPASGPVLHGVSLEVAAGETVAVVGPSGSGKSTLALLLNRFYDPQQGAIRLSSADGAVDLTDVRLASLRDRVGVVFEEPFLFASTVAENIAYGHPDADDAQIRAAAQTAGAAAFIEALPEVYQSPVGERGANLSGGQRQRVALARTLLTDPSVLVLDDAISAVDAATAADISESLADVVRGRTTIVVAHRKATLALASRIVVLDAGRVIDVGTETELAGRCALFASLFGDQDGATATSPPALDASGVTPELWPAVVEPDLEADDGPDEVIVDGMPVERERARELATLPAAKGRPNPRLAVEPGPDAPPLKGLFGILRPVKALVSISVVLMLGDAVVTSAVPALIQRGLDGGVVPGNMPGVWWVAGLSVILVAVNWLVLFVQPRFIARTGESAMFAMRVRSFRHLHSLGLEHFEGQRGGSLLTRMTTDIFALADFVESGLTVAVVNLLTVGVMAAAMVMIDPGLALAAFAVLPVLVLATLVFRRLSAVAYEETRDRTGEVNEDLQENLAGVRTNQASGQSEGAGERFGGLSEALRKIRLKAQSYAAAYFPFVALLGQVATIIVLIVGVRRIADQTLSAGALTAFLLYLGLFFAPFQQLSMIFDGYQRAKVGADRIAELLAMEPAIQSAPDAARVESRLRGDVALEEVSFRYDGADRDAVQELSLAVTAGQRVALVGETGSGKSTLVKLVARLYDATGGRVLVDGTDVRDYDVEALRGRFAVAPQEALLFTGTVADNIRYARPDASDAEVQQAATAVGALSAVARLPGGFRHPLGEQASGLSTGQAQLVALARVRLADRDIVLLDEPTASLDAVSERAVLRAMDQVSADRTTFLVTHRLASAAGADLVAVIDQGRILEQGPPAELLARGGQYAELWRLEHGDEDTPEEDPHPTRTALKRYAYVSAALIQLWAVLRKALVPLLPRPRPKASDE